MLKKITAQFPGVKVLVADDYDINLELAQDMLLLMACDVDAVEDGLAVLKKHEENHYDIIFMDVQMPHMDGFEATQEIRKAEGSQKHTPIIAITANALSGDREKCIKSGMDDYISKPLKGETLEQMLKKYTTPH